MVLFLIHKLYWWLSWWGNMSSASNVHQRTPHKPRLEIWKLHWKYKVRESRPMMWAFLLLNIKFTLSSLPSKGPPKAWSHPGTLPLLPLCLSCLPCLLCLSNPYCVVCLLWFSAFPLKQCPQLTTYLFANYINTTYSLFKLCTYFLGIVRIDRSKLR